MVQAHDIDIIKRVAQETDKVLLFHSLSGKDSICLLDRVAPYFSEVVCVYMYIVPNLLCINRYMKWATSMYKNVKFIQCPHFAVSSWIKCGFLGMKENPKQKKLNLSDITEEARKKTGIDWVFYGMKESDSLNRRIFLRKTAEESNGLCINFKTKKAYPLHLHKHKDIVLYIKEKKLITNSDYGNKRSSSEHPANPIFLSWLRENFPSDLQQVYRYYPEAERILFEYDNYIQQQEVEND